jgi:selenocysteine lyase/cysteine desulfurase
MARVVTAHADAIAAGVREKGYELMRERSPETAAGIVSFRKDGVDARLIVSRLRERGIMAAPRQGWVRMSPHFYLTPDAIGQALGQLL